MADFVMPKLGTDMTTGTLVAWRKKPGDPVRRGDIMAEVETDKGTFEVEAFADGIVATLLAQPGERASVGTVLARIHAEGQPPVLEPALIPTPTGPPPPSPVERAASALSPPTPGFASALRISPAARTRARELGIDPAQVKGTGRGGAITLEDIQRAAAQKPTAPSPALPPASPTPRKPPDSMRQAIAAAMSRSKREIPHYYLANTIDLHRALAWLAEQNLRRPVSDRLLPIALLVKATALALRKVPELNAAWEDNRVVPRDRIHVGVAIALRQGGLIAPAVHDTDRQSLDELMKHILDLTNRARTGGLRGSEISDPTITVTSLGAQGVETVFGIITPPQVALVGFGKIVERPWVVDGTIVVRPVVHATLAADHRVSDGHRGGLYLNALERLLQEPDKL